MNRPRARLLRSGAAAVLAIGAVGAQGYVARADFGGQTVSPAAGSNVTAMTLRTPFDCSAGSTHIQVWMTGAGFPGDPGVDVSGVVALDALPDDGAGPGESVPLVQTMQELADAEAPPAPLAGIHRFVTTCQNGSGSAVFDTFRAAINFGSPTSYQQVEVEYTASVAITAASPISPQAAGTPITFEGQVSPAEAEGSVELFDGGTSLGTTSVVAGAFSLTTSALAALGNRKITPMFTPRHNSYTTITSTDFAYWVMGSAAVPTSTTLSTPTSASVVEPTALTATVSASSGSSTPFGTVEFLDGATSLGTAPVDAAGIATLSRAFSTGPHSVTAAFTPSDDAAFGPSTSPAVAFTSAPALAAAPDEQVLQAEVPAGTIIIDTPYTPANPLDLGVLALNPSGTVFTASAPFEDITISDSRAGNMPWTASAVAETLSNGTGGQINGQNVGLTDLVAVYTPGNGLSPANPVTLTDRPAANPPVAPDAPGEQGLGGSPHALVHADNGTGSVTVNGLLTLNAPSSTPAGVYTGVVTFTVFGS